jgi:arabinose-5-phosphate isomerase
MKANNEIIKMGQRVISVEINGINSLLHSISNDFAEAVKLLINTKGRIVVCGMGKSGHIANKIAATLASTGSPAFFVHPAESTHGDLGMITKDDIVICLSNSGNTPELSGVITYCQRFSIPIIAITANKDSDLGKASKYCLLIPKAEEACSLGLAPTTSTTNTLIIGDALAVVLLELKGFKPEDFKVFHPGGSLGSKLLKIKDIMHKGTEVPTANQKSAMKDALLVITSHKFGCVSILNDNNEMVGIITDGDIRRHMDNNFLNKTAKDIMTQRFLSIQEEDTSSHALLLMNQNKITSLFVLNGKTPVGIIHIHDLLNLGVV